MSLYCPHGFDCDPTYSRGYFYKSVIPVPKYRFDLNPLCSGVVCADAQCLPMPAACISSMILDPPFLPGKQGLKGRMRERFSELGQFQSMDFLYRVYAGMIREAYRVLDRAGIMIFKCQDYTSQIFYPTHIKVYEYATEVGFKAVDLFILLAKSRIIRTDQQQQHARKFHSYFWVFQKQ